jgi:hypothetical protein
VNFEEKPLIVKCDSCGKTAETWDFQHPDLAVECTCCPLPHDHTGLGCRTVTITATAHLTMRDMYADLFNDLAVTEDVTVSQETQHA